TWAKKGTQLARKVAKAGGASAVDVQILETEERSARLAWLEARDGLEDEKAGLGALLVLSPEALPKLSPLSESLPVAIPPDREILLSLLLTKSPELARLEAAHRVAGRELGVELARQLPDLQVGIEAEYEAEGGVIIEIPLGLSLPLWNANREAVAGARAELALARESYRAMLDQMVAAFENANVRLKRLEARLAVLDGEILPAHRQALKDAQRALEVSDFDSLQYVELERAHRELQDSRFELLLEVLTARIELEQTVGAPLFPLPGKPEAQEKEKKK
ncbi:MAG: TolC family protein, partial [Planctomycetota bacterium]